MVVEEVEVFALGINLLAAFAVLVEAERLINIIEIRMMAFFILLTWFVS